MKKNFVKPIVLIFIMVLVFIATVFAIQYVGRQAIESGQQDKLINQRQIIAEQIESQFMQIEAMIFTIGSHIKTQPNNDYLLDYLVDIDDAYDFVSSIYFGMPDKQMINSSGFVPPAGFDLTTRPWYQSAIVSDDVIFTEAFINATQDRIIVTTAYAVYLDDVLLGVVGADIDIRNITAFIADFEIEGGYAYMVDNRNNLIAHPLLPDTISLEKAEDYGLPVTLYSQAEIETERLQVGDEEGHVSYQFLNNTFYRVGVFMNEETFHQSATIFSFASLVVLAIVGMMGLTVLFIYNVFIQRPLDYLVNEIYQIDVTKHPEFRLDSTGKRGFKDVREALNNVLKATNLYQHQAEDRLSELILKNQKFNLLLDSASDIVFEFDKDLKYQEIYGKSLSVFNREEADFVGKTHAEVFGERFAVEREAQYRSVLLGDEVTYTWEYQSQKDRKKHYFEAALSPLYDIKDEIVGGVGVVRDITEQQLRYEELVYISTHDYLTDLYNRWYYYAQMEALDSAKDYPFAVVNIDVNGLKIINDAYGHAVGDEALRKTAEVLVRNTTENDIVSRVSGDEFTIIVPQSNKEMVLELKKKLLKSFANTKVNNMTLSVAIGFYVKTDDSIDVDEVRKLAENDMFRHKVSERRSVKNKAISAILKTLTDKYEIERVHSDRVSKFAVAIGHALDLSDDEIKDLGTAALFHDIGKISIPDELLNKPGKLTDAEFEIMKTHTEVGYEILRAADEYSELAVHASSHHERWDGKGYPRGLKGERIPLYSRIICIADAYEAMTSDRPYRQALSEEKAISEIIKYAGTQFDPKLAKIFVQKVLTKPWIKK